MNIQTTLQTAARKLVKSASSALDAEVLLGHILKQPRAWILANPNYEIPPATFKFFQNLINRRARGEPIAYLIGHKEFFGLDFKINRHVLIPRPETETLAELALKATSYKLPASVIDIGTGSGAIIISLAKHLAEYSRLVYCTPKLYAIDSSAKALAIARGNARTHGVYKKIKFLHGNLLSPVTKATTYHLPPTTLILANLPYLTPKQYASNPELKFEPRQALIGGPDGLKAYRGLFGQLKTLNPRAATVLLEHDPAQKNNLQRLIKAAFPMTNISFVRDLSGRARVAQFRI